MSLPSLEMSDAAAVPCPPPADIDPDQISASIMKNAEALAEIAQDQCPLRFPTAFVSCAATTSAAQGSCCGAG